MSHRFIGNNLNLLRNVAVSADSVRPSIGIFRLPTQREGNGNIAITGAYTGQADDTLDIEIVDGTSGSDLKASTPVLAGVGNGTLTINSIQPAADIQGFTVTLADAGTPDEYAGIEFYGVHLQARAAGAAGNGITVTVDTSGLTFTLLGPLQAELEANQEEYQGALWDFGGLPLTVDGEIPADAPRLAIAGQYPIVRQYQTYADDGSIGYRFSPAPTYAARADAPVYAVTGTYSVTVEQGATTETYPGLVTLYDLLNTLQNRSELVRVVGVVADDATPMGQSARDIPARTAPYALPAQVEGGSAPTHLEQITVESTAETEVINIECVNNTVVGREQWTVKGSKSGVLTGAITNTLYTDPFGDSPVRFLIPRKLPTITEPQGDIFISGFNWQPREPETGVPAICLDRPLLGGSAEAKTLTLTWTRRAADDCDCEDGQVTGGPSEECLGVPIEGDDNVSLIPDYQTRLQSLYTWRATFHENNTDLDASEAYIKAAYYDMELADSATGIFAAALGEICANEAPVAAALTEWDAAFTALQADLSQLSALQGAGAIATYATSTTYSAGAEVVPPLRYWTGHKYRLTEIIGAPTASDETMITDWPIDGSEVPDRSAADYYLWQDVGVIGAADIVTQSNNGPLRNSIEQFVRRYSARMDKVRALHGIVPKSDAGGSESSPCWSDPGDEFVWAFESGGYLPAFTGVYYHSVKRIYNPITERYEIVPTYEFGFALQIGCPERLIEGDQIQIVIDGASNNKTYLVGDIIRLPIVGAGPLELDGGVDGNDTQVWTVRSSVDGAQADYNNPASAPVPYETGDVYFKIAPGTIPFSVGDTFGFAVEGGTFRYRFGAAAWSGAQQIGDSVALANGLTAVFDRGASPSFVTDDLFSWRIEQLYGPASLQSPLIGQAHEWVGPDVTLNADLGSVQTLNAVMLALHTLPNTATATLNGGNAAANEWSETLTWRNGVMLKFIDRSARYVELVITGAEGAQIGWFWLGVPFVPSIHASTFALRRQYAISRGVGNNPSSLYGGQGQGGVIEWSRDNGQYLQQADIDALFALIDHAKAEDEPVCIVPSLTTPDMAALAFIDSDELDLSDWLQFVNDDVGRAYNVSLQLTGVVN